MNFALLIDPSSYSFDSVAISGMLGFLLNRLKASEKVSWINENTPAITRVLGAIVAALSAAGMNIDWNSANGVGTLTVSGISFASVSTLLFATAKNYFIQSGTDHVLTINERLKQLEEKS